MEQQNVTLELVNKWFNFGNISQVEMRLQKIKVHMAHMTHFQKKMVTTMVLKTLATFEPIFFLV